MWAEPPEVHIIRGPLAILYTWAIKAHLIIQFLQKSCTQTHLRCETLVLEGPVPTSFNLPWWRDLFTVIHIRWLICLLQLFQVRYSAYDIRIHPYYLHNQVHFMCKCIFQYPHIFMAENLWWNDDSLAKTHIKVFYLSHLFCLFQAHIQLIILGSHF